MSRPTLSAVEEVRVTLGMSRRQLAARAGVDRTYLGRYERGEVTPTRHWVRRVSSTLARIAATSPQENDQ